MRVQADDVVKSLNLHRSKIIEKLSDKNWKHFEEYCEIKREYSNNCNKDFDEQFKRIFCRFFALNGARGLNQKQKDKFFELFSLNKKDLKEILEILYEIPGHGKRHKLFISFGTKLLHIINDELPIYDKNIDFVLNLPGQTYPSSLEERIKNRLDIYKELKNTTEELLANDKIKNYLKSIRQEMRRTPGYDNFTWQDKDISDVKLFDSLLWALYFFV